MLYYVWDVVEFADKSLAVIPQVWFMDEGSVFWPPKNQGRLAAEGALPREDWSLETVVFVHFKGIEKIDKAMKKMAKLEKGYSYLSTTDDESLGRGMRMKFRRRESPSSDDSELSQPSAGGLFSKASSQPLTSQPLPSQAPLQPLDEQCKGRKLPRRLDDRDGRSHDDSGEPEQKKALKIPELPQPPAGLHSKASSQPLTSQPLTSQPLPLQAPLQPLDEISKLTKEVGELRKDIKKVMQTLKFIKNEITSGKLTDNASQPPHIPAPSFHLPFSSLEDLTKAEKKLEEEEEFNRFVNHITTFSSGKTGGQCAKRILSRLISPDVGRQFSWKGRKGKMAFGELKLANAIKNAVRLYFKDQVILEKEIEIAGGEWLAQQTYTKQKKI